MRRVWALVSVLSFLALQFAACGGHSPTAPSPSTTSGATVAGSITAGNPAVLSNLKVSVAGAGPSSTVDGSGAFALTSVPAGDQQLQFSGAGIDARLSLTGIRPDERVTLRVRLNGSAVTLDSQMGITGNDAEIEGTIDAVPPTTPAGSFTLGGLTITTDGNTKFSQHGTAKTFADLKVGLQVEVHGTSSGGGTLATLVEIESAETKVVQADAEVEGKVTSKTGTPPNLTLIVNGATVKTDASTVVNGHSEGITAPTLSTITVGMTIQVKGTRQTDGSVNARSIEIDEQGDGENGGSGGDDRQGDEHNGTDLEGSLSGLQGTCPAIQFVLKGKTVFTDSSTTFGVSCSLLKTGSEIEVKGTVQTDGRVRASSVNKN